MRAGEPPEPTAVDPRPAVVLELCGKLPTGVVESQLTDLVDRTLSALRRLGQSVPPHCVVSVRFATDGAVRRFNRDYRGIDRATDILSFPLAEMVDGAQHLGDLLISRDRVRVQALRSRLSERRETEELVLHGLLHLLGYDHENDDGRMDALELELRAIVLDAATNSARASVRVGLVAVESRAATAVRRGTR